MPHVDLLMTCGKRASFARCVRDAANGGDRWCAEAESGRHGPRLRQLFLTWFRRRRRLTLLPGRKPGRSTGRDSGAEGRPDARETWTKELEGGPKGSIFYFRPALFRPGQRPAVRVRTQML